MSYTVEIKQEISSLPTTNSEMIAELSGFVRNNAYINNDTLFLTTENEFTIDRLQSFFQKLYEVDLNIEIKDNLNFNKKNLYLLSLNQKLPTILKDLGYYDENNNYLDTPPTYIVGANEEIRAYLRGSFLCTGSINNPQTSRYHMELLISKPGEAVFIQKLLNIFDLNAKILNREKGYMIYIKEAEKISDFIKILGANNAVMYYENVRIYRDQKNKTNRLNNMEQANIDRVFETANEQLRQIKIIEDNNGMDLLDDRTKLAVRYRKEYPETSLKELAEIITLETGKSLSKSGINHRFRKVRELAASFEKMNKKD